MLYELLDKSMILSSKFLVTLLVHSQKKKDLSMPFLLHQVEMELSRRSKIKHFAFSKCTGLTSLFNSFNKRCS